MPPSGFRLGVLDLGYAPFTLEIAPEVDALGFSRLWITEHHGLNGCPELLLPLLAAATEHLSVGSGGVLLPYYSPFKVAESFHLLESMFPGRVDLGFCRGLGGSAASSAALLDGRPVRDYEQRVDELLAYMRNEGSEKRAHLAPRASSEPLPWCLGSGEGSAMIAATRGLPYGYSMHVGPDRIAAVECYRHNFRPGPFATEPRVIVSVAGVCAETAEHAARLEAETAGMQIKPNIAGSAATCTDWLQDVQRRYGADEILWLDLSRALDDQLRAFALLADGFELRGTFEQSDLNEL